jgi:mRNA interferase MazF
MRRGDIHLVDLGPSVGAEVNRRRPAIVVSNDGANRAAEQSGHGVVTVVPVTSNTERIYRFQVLLPAVTSGLERDSKAQAEQIRSVAVERIGPRVGTLPAPLMRQLDEALRLHMAL